MKKLFTILVIAIAFSCNQNYKPTEPDPKDTIKKDTIIVEKPQ